jgi:hypothetical protein
MQKFIQDYVDIEAVKNTSGYEVNGRNEMGGFNRCGDIFHGVSVKGVKFYSSTSDVCISCDYPVVMDNGKTIYRFTVDPIPLVNTGYSQLTLKSPDKFTAHLSMIPYEHRPKLSREQVWMYCFTEFFSELVPHEISCIAKKIREFKMFGGYDDHVSDDELCKKICGDTLCLSNILIISGGCVGFRCISGFSRIIRTLEYYAVTSQCLLPLLVFMFENSTLPHKSCPFLPVVTAVSHLDADNVHLTKNKEIVYAAKTVEKDKDIAKILASYYGYRSDKCEKNRILPCEIIELYRMINLAVYKQKLPPFPPFFGSFDNYFKAKYPTECDCQYCTHMRMLDNDAKCML